MFRSGPVVREGCQFLHSPGVLRVTCYFHAIILHFLCFKTFYQFGLIHGCASYMDGMSKCIASDRILAVWINPTCWLLPNLAHFSNGSDAFLFL